MPRQANGVALQPANTAAVGSTTISSSAFNTLITDVYSELTNSVDRGGRSAMTAALPMGNQKITGMADPTIATDGATKNYVDTTTAAFFSTGDGKITLKTVADTGWILCDDGTFGSATSGSSNRANADTQALFTLFFNNISDTAAPLLTSGGGATTRAAQTNASSAWAANCRMTLTKQLGRAIAVAGTGAGLTARPLGSSLGEEAHPLTTAELAAHTHANSLTDPGHTHTIAVNTSGNGSTSVTQGQTGGSSVPGGISTTQTGISITNASAGSGNAHNNMQPTTFWNVMIKLN